MAGATDRLVEAWDDYIVPLRSNEGFQEERYEALAAALRNCASEWRDAESIPRLAANVLVDVVPLSQAAAEAYEEPVRQQIMDASFTLYDLVIECVGSEPD